MKTGWSGFLLEKDGWHKWFDTADELNAYITSEARYPYTVSTVCADSKPPDVEVAHET